MPPARKSKPVDWRDFGPPPADTLEANDWAFRVLAQTMHMAMLDASLSEVTRRKEVREIADSMRGIIPMARLMRAEAAVRGEHHAMSNGTGPEMEHAPQLTSSDGQPKAKRGRPRKRSLL